MPEEPTNQPGETPAPGETPGEQMTFDGWLGEQPDDVKSLLDEHTSGLKTALQREREQRKELAGEVKALAKKADAGSEAREALDNLAAKLEAAERKANFYEAVAGQVSNPRLAWLAAESNGYVNDDGTVQMETLKAEFPELFKPTQKPVPPGNAGNGAGQGGAGQPDMNAYIRAAAGRSP